LLSAEISNLLCRSPLAAASQITQFGNDDLTSDRKRERIHIRAEVLRDVSHGTYVELGVRYVR
jgi:hypothetical protein